MGNSVRNVFRTENREKVEVDPRVIHLEETDNRLTTNLSEIFLGDYFNRTQTSSCPSTSSRRSSVVLVNHIEQDMITEESLTSAGDMSMSFDPFCESALCTPIEGRSPSSEQMQIPTEESDSKEFTVLENNWTLLKINKEYIFFGTIVVGVTLILYYFIQQEETKKHFESIVTTNVDAIGVTLVLEL